MMARSTIWIILVIYSLISGAGAIFAHWDIDLPFWDTPVANGQDAHLRCIASDVDSQDELTIEKVVETDNGPVYIPIATNVVVQSPYSSLNNRYTSVHEIQEDNNLQILDLHISDTVGDDGGTFRCKVSSTDETSEEKLLIVQVPVTRVNAFYRNASRQYDVTHGEQITWRAIDMDRVGCQAVVEGVDTPVVEVQIGGMNVSGEFIVASVVDTATEDPSLPGLYHFSVVTTRSSYHAPTYAYTGMTLSCIAYSPGYESQSKTTTHNLVIEGPPAVSCSKVSYEPGLGTTLSMPCNVTANPAPDGMSLTAWRANDSTSFINTPISGDSEVEGISVRVMVNGDVTDVTFTIPSIQEEHLDMSFTLTAVNPYGQNTVAFNITGDGGITSGCSTHVWSTSLLLAVTWSLVKTLLS